MFLIKLKTHPFFSLGFRSMFFFAALSAFIMPALWVSFYTGKTAFPGGIFSPMDWHGFEMYSGFASALVAGFLLTASANWSGSPAVSGYPLFFLSLFWLLERIIFLIPHLPYPVYVISSLPFPLLFLVILTIQLKTNTKNRNIFLPWLILFFFAKFLYIYSGIYKDAFRLLFAKELFVSSLRIIIVVITGRIIPFFMEKRIGFRPKVPLLLEYGSIISVSFLIFANITVLPAFTEAILYLFAVLMNSIRFFYWRPLKTIKVPILLILHIGYLWLILHLLLSFYGKAFQNPGPVTLHFFSTGALGTFAIGMMTRVALGHSGRIIHADKWILFMYACVQIGAILRTIIPLFFNEIYFKSLHYSSGFWTLAFMIYLIRFTPILYKKRMDAES
ncbi:MAG: NnrS family protein [Leptospiraceae bacterium]|nr:NnrS family protein [Leptospiraceae bacterium]MCP5499450.1 NnrS family protein [Leptospiraceae bacterium]